MEFLIVGLGGSLGAICRYSVYLLEKPFGMREFPFWTLIINLIGSFIAGSIFALSERLLPEHRGMVLFVTVGFTGSFTTFSTLSVETFQLFKSNPSMAVLNISLNLILGIGAVALSRSLFLKI